MNASEKNAIEQIRTSLEKETNALEEAKNDFERLQISSSPEEFLDKLLNDIGNLIVKIKNFLLRLINRPICIYLIGKLTIRIEAKIIRKKQNCAQKFISGELNSRDLPSMMNGAETNKAAPGTGIPLKNPGILF